MTADLKCEVCGSAATYRCAFGPKLYHYLCAKHKPRVSRFKVLKSGKVKPRRRGGLKMTAKDMAWAKAVKKRDGSQCQRCIELAKVARIDGIPYTAPRGLHAAHVFSRGKGSTRTELDNGITLCWRHHRWAAANEEEFRTWIRSRLGEARWERLEKMANQSTKKVTV